jgi:hypothetical protein
MLGSPVASVGTMALATPSSGLLTVRAASDGVTF